MEKVGFGEFCKRYRKRICIVAVSACVLLVLILALARVNRGKAKMEAKMTSVKPQIMQIQNMDLDSSSLEEELESAQDDYDLAVTKSNKSLKDARNSLRQ